MLQVDELPARRRPSSAPARQDLLPILCTWQPAFAHVDGQAKQQEEPTEVVDNEWRTREQRGEEHRRPHQREGHRGVWSPGSGRVRLGLRQRTDIHPECGREADPGFPRCRTRGLDALDGAEAEARGTGKLLLGPVPGLPKTTDSSWTKFHIPPM